LSASDGPTVIARDFDHKVVVKKDFRFATSVKRHDYAHRKKRSHSVSGALFISDRIMQRRNPSMKTCTAPMAINRSPKV
jgi:hypothetical protein